MAMLRRPPPERAGEGEAGSTTATSRGAAPRKRGLWASTYLVAIATSVFLFLFAAAAAGARRGQFPAAAGAGNAVFTRASELVQGSSDGEVSAMPSIAGEDDKTLLGGLLASGFDEHSCLSRYQSAFYRKRRLQVPSAHLIRRLRSQESLQKKCGPNSVHYKKALERLNSGGVGDGVGEDMECKYLVWIAYSGLGNRILTIASAFLYALLTDRVMLVDRGKFMADLFCEPFPDTSWFLPPDFPVKQFKNLSIHSPESFGNLLKDGAIDSLSSRSYMYLHLDHDYGNHDKLFFCDNEQQSLAQTPWLVLRSDNYFVPSLFLIPAFRKQLGALFPRKDMVFHHLGRYLFHPTNAVWGLVTRYYHAYLARVDRRLGIQIRVFESGAGPFQHITDQIVACTLKERLLPEISTEQLPPTVLTAGAGTIAVLMTSLDSAYYEHVRDMYWEHASASGEAVAVFQPSHEEHQRSERRTHNMKALAEMYLLSMTDALVTSAWSTFGYVAQGLGGLEPWVLLKPDNMTAPNPPCVRVASMEPCFHAPPFWDCKAKKGVDTGKLIPNVVHCEDMSWGLKLVDR